MAKLRVPELKHREITVRPVHLRDAAEIGRLLRTNRQWLEPWEATLPEGGIVQPGSVSMRPTVRWQRRQARRGESITCSVLLSSQVVGQVSLHGIQRGVCRSGQIGYWIAERAAGHGIIPIAVALLSDWALTAGGLHRIEICLLPENAPSTRVVEKLGFRYEGLRKNYIHINGRWADHAAYAVCAEEVPPEGLLSRVALR